jgi:hypothetical protein
MPWLNKKKHRVAMRNSIDVIMELLDPAYAGMTAFVEPFVQ